MRAVIHIQHGIAAELMRRHRPGNELADPDTRHVLDALHTAINNPGMVVALSLPSRRLYSIAEPLPATLTYATLTATRPDLFYAWCITVSGAVEDTSEAVTVLMAVARGELDQFIDMRRRGGR